MAPTLPALLCLGLSVGLRTQVQAGTFPKPIIWAEPSSVVPSGSSVTILCQGPPNTKSFSLNKEGDSAPRNMHPALKPWDKANFFISNVREQQAGRYHCSHFIGVNWSEPSEPLDLLVAGEEPAGRLRDRPSLSVRPSPSVAPGENVTLLCQSGERTDTFLLSKEGAAHRPLRLRSQDQDRRYQAEFSLSPVTSAHGGTYRCYGSLSTDPYLLSQPSEPLALVVSGLTWYLSVLIGVSVTFVLLLLVLLFLFLHHRGQDRCRKSRAADPGPEDRGPQSSSSPATDSQDQAICEQKRRCPPGVTETSGGSGGGTLRRVGYRGWGLKPYTALPQVQGREGAERPLEAVGGMLRRVGEHTAPTGMQGGGSSPEALGTPPSSALCSAADAAMSDTHSEVGLQLDHRAATSEAPRT
uniref:Ig-like domain-containing protein n=1 Tax=Bos mutus grunniens TaxID=30521 RepID=A0A8B9Y500_BOSMU